MWIWQRAMVANEERAGGGFSGAIAFGSGMPDE
jgi:hypothetical protein